jgi:hypothetical protein
VSKAKRTAKRTTSKEDKAPGNYIDTFVKRMFGRVLVFTDFMLNYADKQFVSVIDITKIQLAPTHYLGKHGDERIVDLVWRCPLKTGDGSLMAVIVFENENKSLKHIPRKLHKNISAIWDAEAKEGNPLSAPYFLVLRTGKKAHRRRFYTMADSLPKDKDGKPIGKTVEVTYDVVDLPAWEFDDLVGGAVLRSTLMMLHTTTGGNLDDFPKALQPLLELPEGERIEVTKELIDFVANAFAAKSRKLDAATASAAVETIFKGKGQAMMKTIFDEQRDIGIAEGEARGKTEGKSEAGREMVLTVLRARFKRIPKEVEKAIGQMNDTISLKSWAAQAATCQSMAEFVELLK